MNENEDRNHSPLSAEQADSLSLGNITITDDVIATIAASAAAKVEGVHVVGSGFRLGEFLGGKDSARRGGISVHMNEDTGHAEIDVDITVRYGTNIYEAACRVQNTVHDEIEALTGTMNVDKVNVNVRKLRMTDEPEPEDVITPDKAYAEELGPRKAPANKPEPAKSENENQDESEK